MNLSSWLENPEQLTQSVKDLTASVKDLSGKATDQFNKLTTTQKVVGGALLVSGLSWLALRSKSAPKGESRANTDYRSRPYGAAGKTADQRFQGPYGNSATRGISDDYPTKSSKQYHEDETAGFGEADYSTDL